MPHIGRIKRSLVGEKHSYTDPTQMVLCMPSSYCWIYAICALLENNEDTKEILRIQEHALTIGDKGVSSKKFQQVCDFLGINLVV